MLWIGFNVRMNEWLNTSLLPIIQYSLFDASPSGNGKKIAVQHSSQGTMGLADQRQIGHKHTHTHTIVNRPNGIRPFNPSSTNSSNEPYQTSKQTGGIHSYLWRLNTCYWCDEGLGAKVQDQFRLALNQRSLSKCWCHVIRVVVVVIATSELIPIRCLTTDENTKCICVFGAILTKLANCDPTYRQDSSIRASSLPWLWLLW